MLIKSYVTLLMSPEGQNVSHHVADEGQNVSHNVADEG